MSNFYQKCPNCGCHAKDEYWCETCHQVFSKCYSRKCGGVKGKIQFKILAWSTNCRIVDEFNEKLNDIKFEKKPQFCLMFCQNCQQFDIETTCVDILNLSYSKVLSLDFLSELLTNEVLIKYINFKKNMKCLL